MATKPKVPKILAPGVELPRYDLADATALQALAGGVADEDQQKRALKWIVENAAAMYEWPYKEQPRETDIALGRQLVGQSIVGLLKLNLSDLRRKDNVPA